MRFLVVAIALLSAVRPTVAWGSLGHRTVAYLAFKYLNSDTSQYLQNVLGGQDVSDAAVWADEVRRHRPYTEGWHFIDARDSAPESCGVQYPADCGDPGSDSTCIITALANETALFMSPDTDSDTRYEALKYVLHFIGDIHQPLHVENAYRGGNEVKVCFGSRCAHENLHSVWDTSIPEKIVGLRGEPHPAQEREAAQRWADSLYSAAMADARDVVSAKDECNSVTNPDSCTVSWASESNAYVCSYVMKPGIDWLEQNDLSLDYYEGAKTIVESQISKAGARLAAWLEAIVAGSQSTRINAHRPTQQVLGEGEL